MKKLILAAAMVALSSGTAFAATTQGTATATVVAPLTITHTPGAALRFGSFTVGTGGTVVVTNAGAASATGGVAILAGSTNSADSFAVAGDGNRTFTITTGGGNVTSGAATIPFTTTNAGTGTLATGVATINVGGTLTVASTVAAGSYTGTYSATVNYN